MKMRHRRRVRRDERAAADLRWLAGFKPGPRFFRTTFTWTVLVEPDYAADTLAALKGDGTEQLPPGTNPIKGEIVSLLP